MSDRRRTVVVAGCGRLGATLASTLSRAGHGVVALDIRPAAFDKLDVDFGGLRLEGDVTEIALLREAGLESADMLVAATHDDNVNLMVAQIGRHLFEVATVIARVYDPRREESYRRLGVRTVSPTSLVIEEILADPTFGNRGAAGGEGPS